MPISPRYRERKHKGNEETFDNKTIINYLNFKLPKQIINILPKIYLNYLI